jgi:hypothetical protein
MWMVFVTVEASRRKEHPMLIHPNLSLQLALSLHQERVARAESWRRVARTRPARDAQRDRHP